jgi:hypothetical protein
VSESNSPVIRIKEISGLAERPEKTIKDCDIKCVEALNYILRKRNLEAILPIKLVHKEKAAHGALYMMYEAPNTIIIDDSNEFVQYLYNDNEDLQTRHEVLAIMLGFLLENMTRVIATKPFDFNEEIALVCDTKLESRNFWKRNTDIHCPSTYINNAGFGGFVQPISFLRSRIRKWLEVNYSTNIQQIYLFCHFLGIFCLAIFIHTFLIKLAIWTFGVSYGFC